MQECKLTREEKVWIDNLEGVIKINYFFVVFSCIFLLAGVCLMWQVYKNSDIGNYVMCHYKIENLVNATFAFMFAFLGNAINTSVKIIKLVRTFKRVFKKLSTLE